MPTKKTKKAPKVIATRPVSTLDLTKPLKVSAAATPRSKSDVFGTIAEHGVFIAATSRPSFTRSVP